MPKTRRINWDVLRVLAVLAVLLQHATHAGPSAHPEIGSPAFTVSLEMGASALVVISAFFTCASLAKGHRARFLRNRLARLLPAYAVAATCTYGVLRYLAPQGWSHLEPRDLLLNVLMLQNWFPDVRLVDFSYWTLPVQVTGFVAGALLASRVRGRALPPLLWGLVLGPLVLRLWTVEPGLVRTFYDGLGVHRAQLFAAGVGIWLWSKGRLGDGHLIVLLAAALGAQWVHSADLESTLGLGVLLVGVCAAAAGPDWDVWPVRVLARPVQWLAGISYGVYLVHQEIGYVVMERLTGFGPWVQLVAFTGVAVALGWLLTKLVERPVYRLLTTSHRPVLVRLLLAGRLTLHSQLGSAGAVPSSRVPSWRPVSHPIASAAAPLSEVDASLPVVVNSQLR
ncbi:acyltransferase [Saccharothrix coeruleofusca]|uniref:Acyltransferase n=1 Tax=Saccharothrix coeruleofusca TaxID=33919 RepID=A0A918AM25_9PSEU|nr:acyltransferase [Saccharothrix coeruleofusca]MBP2338089.1 peptidoglycan/LPS O-acetylase OafA/YrhL [Saccharothrix coeruleofusca]GGP50818.1 acyltransferase [Saccharothrix coeruleofusca]